MMAPVALGRPFIDLPNTQPDEDIRDLLAELISQFVAANTRADNTQRQALENTLLAGHPLIKRGASR